MFCSQCGAAVQGGTQFCWKCGAKIVGESAAGRADGEASRGFGGLGDLVDTGGTASRSAEFESEESAAKGELPLPRGSGPAAQPVDTGTTADRQGSTRVRSGSEATGPADESRKFLGGVHHPWRRYFAKTLDLVLLGVLGYVILFVALSVVAPGAAARLDEAMSNQVVATMVMVGLWIPVESILLATIGTTPARALFGIRLQKRGGARLRFSEAFVRSFSLAIQGMGVGIPLVAVFTQWFAYRRLTRTGTTLWDTAGDCEVTHGTWSVGRAVSCVAVCAVVFVALVAADTAVK